MQCEDGSIIVILMRATYLDVGALVWLAEVVREAIVHEALLDAGVVLSLMRLC